MTRPATPEEIARFPGRPTNVYVTRIDAELVEKLSEATVRSGDISLAIEGFALTLRLRAATNSWEERRESDRRQP